MSSFFDDLLKLGRKIAEVSDAIQSQLDERSPTPRAAESGSSSAAESANAEPANDTPSLYQRHLANGCPNPMELLTPADAEQMMGCVLETYTTGEEEYVGVHYGCADERSMYVSLSVSALMPWDIVVHEANTTPAPRAVGDEALVADDMLYVRCGQSFFWLYGNGVETDTIYRIAEHVARNLSM